MYVLSQIHVGNKSYRRCVRVSFRLQISLRIHSQKITLVLGACAEPVYAPVFRIHRIHMFLGLQDPNPDPLVRGMDPDPSIVMQK